MITIVLDLKRFAMWQSLSVKCKVYRLVVVNQIRKKTFSTMAVTYCKTKIPGYYWMITQQPLIYLIILVKIL